MTGLITGDWPRVGASGSTNGGEPGTVMGEKRQIPPSLIMFVWKPTVKPHSSGDIRHFGGGLGDSRMPNIGAIRDIAWD